ncbi:MAG: class I SAM-dependent RNA methyltransferase [Pyrinomonadaceae bacterium]
MTFAPRKVPERPQPTLEVEVERILPGGVGLAHAEGLTIFVSLAAPGDVVRVQIEKTRGKVAFATIKEIVKPSPVRIEPPCPYFGRCGGCDFQHLEYEAQLEAKVGIVQDCLHRIAGLADVPEIKIHPSPRSWHYRSRANWQFNQQTRALGYFERGTHRVCDVAECAVLVPELQATLEKLREEIRDNSLEIAVSDVDVVAGDNCVSVNPPCGEFSSHEVRRQVGNETYYFNPNAFFQTNHNLLEPLVDVAIGEMRGRTAIDLYCGVGLFTLPLARRFEHVIGVESSRIAARFAEQNLDNAGLLNAQIVTSRLADWLRQNSHAVSADFVLLDPPRTGAEAGVIEGVVGLRPQHVSYVSCDPATLARDLKVLLARGYLLDSVAAFDMFPQTHHVETVVDLAAQGL